ncbi:hypothetical protein V5O48_006994 [Marasmius crinis-equi]|uniref:Uncharacterized protein n=1 Tax=Marasmius crinis-equi TaxID=585013 RepID=A0ABR3FHZ1_9AGAR
MDRRGSVIGMKDETSDGKTLNMERELDLALCRCNLTAFAQPFLDFIRQHTGMVCFLQAGYERDHPSEGHDFEIVSLSSVPEGAPKFPDHNMSFFGQFGREFAKWVRAIKQHQMEMGVEYPLSAALEGATDGKDKGKDKGKKKAVPTQASASPTLPTPPPDLSARKSVAPASTSAASASTICKGKSSQRSGSSSKPKPSPSPEPANSTPRLLPQPPSTDGMSI